MSQFTSKFLCMNTNANQNRHGVYAARRWIHQVTASMTVLLGSAVLSVAQGQVLIPQLENVSIIKQPSGSRIEMWIPTQMGVNYRAEFKNFLGGGSWAEFYNFAGDGEIAPITQNNTGISRRFYRVTVLPAPVIRNQPLSRTVLVGDTVQLSVVATGMPPLVYSWHGPNGPLSNDAHVSGADGAVLTITNLDFADVGNYWVAIQNGFGNVTSNSAGVRVTVSQAPRVLADPLGQSVLTGQSLTLSALAGGAQPLTYKWYGPSGPLLDDGRISGSSSLTLRVDSLRVEDDGGYYLHLTNPFGTASTAIAVVRVQPGQSPRVTLGPSSQTVVGGQQVTLSVVATGTAPLTYRWYGPAGLLQDGGRIGGAATAILSIENFQAADNGEYHVAITNGFGAVSSNGANVRVQ